MPEPVPLHNIVEFLKRVPPFHLLEEGAVADLARMLAIEYFPKGEVILSPYKPPAPYLYVIRSGGIKFLVPDKRASTQGEVHDYRDEGECFNLFSLLSGKPAPFVIVAEEDTLCYLIREEIFRRLTEAHPDVLHYFTMGPGRGTRRPDSLAGGALSKGGQEAGQILFTAEVREIMRRDVVTCPPEETVVGVARQMTAMDTGSVIVVDEEKGPVGIVTDEDLRVRFLSPGKLVDLPVWSVMSRPVPSIPARAFCFEAVLAMAKNRSRYLAVMEGRRLLGILSDHDLMISQGNNPVAVIREIEQAADLNQVARIRTSIDRTMRVILEHGGMARDLCELVTTFNDHLTRKILLLAEEAMVREGRGKAPVPWCWIAMGSEGRREQTLRTDQDNGLIFADPAPEAETEAQGYFLALAEKGVAGLEQCGFPRCRGGVMAVNPRWCQPVKTWVRTFREWIEGIDLSPQETMLSSLLFDIRPIHGADGLALEVTGQITEALRGRKAFLRALAENAVLHQTPLGFFKRFVVEKSGAHRNELNVKLHGLTPLVDTVRSLALEHGIGRTSTLDRITGLADAGVLQPTEAEDLREAFNVIMLLRIRHHVGALREEKAPDDYINPAELSLIQRTMLREAFKAIDRVQKGLALRYDIRVP